MCLEAIGGNLSACLVKGGPAASVSIDQVYPALASEAGVLNRWMT